MRIVWIIIGAAVGFVVADSIFAIIAYVVMGAPSASQMQANPSAAGMLAFGPLVGPLGLGLGIWLAWRLTRRSP
jgi:hypothetical protein